MQTAARKLLLISPFAISLALVTLAAVKFAGGDPGFGGEASQERSADVSFGQPAGTESDQVYVSAVPLFGQQQELRQPGWHNGCSFWRWWHCYVYCAFVGYLKPYVGCPSFFNGYK